MSLAINPLENRWPIKSGVQGEPSLINADCQGASLMYFSFKESVSNAHRIFYFFFFAGWEQLAFFSLSLLQLVCWSRMGGAEMEGRRKPETLRSSAFMDEMFTCAG